MTASSGIAAKGTVLTYNSQAVKELDNVELTGSNGEEIDISNHDSPDDYKEFVIGLLDGGTISFSGNFVSTDAGQAAVIAAHYARTNAAWTVVYPDVGDSQFAGNGMVKSFQISAPVAGKLSISGTIKITGKPTFTA
jgi:predicted secreted protein